MLAIIGTLVCSFHWGIHFVSAVLAQYQRYAAHFAIDSGAVPHVLTAEDPRFMEITDYMRSITEDQGIHTTFRPEGNEVEIVI